jgi:recombination protein RecA
MDGVIPTGFPALDQALSIGGIPRGQITEISGAESSGKTTLCQFIIARAQERNGICAFIDTDHCFDPRYAAWCGIKLDRLYLAEPASAEQALDTTHILARSGAFRLIVIDSLNTLMPMAELSAPLGALTDEPAERVVSKWLPDLHIAIQRNQTALIVTDLIVSGMSVIYHELQTHLSRLALPLNAALRLKINPLVGSEQSQPLQRIQVQIVKNKFAPCFNTIDLDIIDNRGNE